MKYVRLFLLTALLLVLAACALADGAETVISGNAGQTLEFYVYTSGSASLTFSQEKGSIQRSVGGKSSIYGGFDITWYQEGQAYSAQTAALEKASASIRLNGAGYYTVRLTPYSMERLKARDNYLGYPGAYVSWLSPARWSLSNAGGCRVSLTPMASSYGPSYITAAPWYAPQATATPRYGYYPYATATPRYGYYPYATATPQPSVTARIYVYYRLTDGSLITFKTKDLTPGTHYITNELTGSYFSLVGMPYQTVTVYANGQASATSVTFYFQYNSVFAPTATPTPTPTPTPIPTAVPRSAAIRIYYKLLDGTVLSYETRVLYEGLYQLAYDGRYNELPGLRFIGPASYQVVIYGNGAASVSELTFYFSQQAVATPTPTPIPYFYYTPTPAPYALENEAATNQTAIIGAQKIFPRPQPGKGKNTFNYEAAGQMVTVHSKAKSLQNDNTWWICFSGSLKCWGKTYEIDHMWIRVDYFNQKSFDLDALPLDPRYSK